MMMNIDYGKHELELAKAILGDLWGLGTWVCESSSWLDADYWFGSWICEHEHVPDCQVEAMFDMRRGLVIVQVCDLNGSCVDQIIWSIGDPDMFGAVRGQVRAWLVDVVQRDLPS